MTSKVFILIFSVFFIFSFGQKKKADKNDEIFAQFEICFECSGIESSPKKMPELIETCEYLYPELETFFKSNGLSTEYLERK